MSAKIGIPKSSLICLFITYQCALVVTLGLQHLEHPHTAASSVPPHGVSIVDHMADEPLIKQHTVPDKQATSPIKEGVEQAQSLRCLSSHLVNVYRPGQPCIKGHPKKPCCFDPLD